MTEATSSLEIRSLIRSSGQLELSLARTPIAELAPHEVLVRVEAAPINPSDLARLLGAADPKTVTATGEGEGAVVTATVPAPMLATLAGRLDQSLPAGNEGAGVVVRAGSSAAAQALLGRTVACLGGAMYAQYRALNAGDCLALPEGTLPADGAAAFVNPLTALGMVETMRREGHTALVHTAAASNLGQMLNRICLADGVGLVNIVRSAEQVALLREAGAEHVCDSNSPDFIDELTDAVAATGATIGFDAVGGGPLAGQIVTAMEAAANRNAATYNRYGSTVHKQVYIYGGLDAGPTILDRRFGMAWGIGGWLLFPFLEKIGPQASEALRQRVAAELKTTFASHYAAEISLAEVLHPDIIAAYARRATGDKYLINPQKGL